jgi:hypothetical protein
MIATMTAMIHNRLGDMTTSAPHGSDRHRADRGPVEDADRRDERT